MRATPTRTDICGVWFGYAERGRYRRDCDSGEPRLNLFAECFFIEPRRLLRWCPSLSSGVMSALCFRPSSLSFLALRSHSPTLSRLHEFVFRDCGGAGRTVLLARLDERPASPTNG